MRVGFFDLLLTAMLIVAAYYGRADAIYIQKDCERRRTQVVVRARQHLRDVHGGSIQYLLRPYPFTPKNPRVTSINS